MSPALANRISAAQVSLVMSGVMSAVMVLINQGWSPAIFAEWGRSWVIGFSVAYPTASVIVPLSRRWVEKVARPAPTNS